MAKKFAEPSETDEIFDCEPYKLLRSNFEIIGKVIMLGAELEHILTIALFNVTNIEPFDGFIMFGKSTVGAGIEKLRAALSHKQEFKTEKESFDLCFPDMKDFIAMRNVMAHGVFLGIKDTKLHFLVTENANQINEDSAMLRVARLDLRELKRRQIQGRKIIDHLRKTFDITALHERRVLREAQKKAPDK